MFWYIYQWWFAVLAVTLLRSQTGQAGRAERA